MHNFEIYFDGIKRASVHVRYEDEMFAIVHQMRQVIDGPDYQVQDEDWHSEVIVVEVAR
jgi:hypothetical protein